MENLKFIIESKRREDRLLFSALETAVLGDPTLVEIQDGLQATAIFCAEGDCRYTHMIHLFWSAIDLFKDEFKNPYMKYNRDECPYCQFRKEHKESNGK